MFTFLIMAGLGIGIYYGMKRRASTILLRGL
jgi:hypothetical protein